MQCPYGLYADGRIASTAAVGKEGLKLQLAADPHIIQAGEVGVAGVVGAQHAPLTPLLCQQLVILFPVEDVSFVEIHHISQMSAQIEECEEKKLLIWCNMRRD